MLFCRYIVYMGNFEEKATFVTTCNNFVIFLLTRGKSVVIMAM